MKRARDVIFRESFSGQTGMKNVGKSVSFPVEVPVMSLLQQDWLGREGSQLL